MPIEKKEDEISLLSELINLIESAKVKVVVQANSTVTILFWQIGNRIFSNILNNKRAEYGKQIVATLSRDLVIQFGRNYEEKNLRRMIQFAETYPNFENVVTLSRHLSWSHFLVMIPLKNENARSFYEQLTFNNLLGVRGLRKQISRKAFERTKKSDIQLLNNKDIEKGVFKDPYLLDFLELKDGYLENDLESAILKELELFILELGSGFTFVARQKRMIIDGDDYNLDLLFYHRRLKRLVAVELKIDKFRARHKGQMELYLKWLDKYEKQEGEQQPIGLILCAEASQEQIELLEMHRDGIMVAEYWTELPAKEMLEAKLHEVLISTRERIERKQLRKG